MGTREIMDRAVADGLPVQVVPEFYHHHHRDLAPIVKQKSQWSRRRRY